MSQLVGAYKHIKYRSADWYRLYTVRRSRIETVPATTLNEYLLIHLGLSVNLVKISPRPLNLCGLSFVHI